MRVPAARVRVCLAGLLVGGVLLAATVATASVARPAGAGSEIVFASDRANANPGEIYALAAGRAPLDVSRSAAADANGAVSPDGRLVAYWSDRTGTWRLYVSRADGSHLRQVPAPVLGGTGGGGPLAFAPDGSRLLATLSTGVACRLFVVDVRSLRVSRAGAGCAGASAWSPDGSRIVAGLVGRPAHLVVEDTRGRQLFSLPGLDALWSPRGQLAVVGRAGTTTIVDANGSILTRLPAAAAAWSADGTRLVLARPGAIVIADSLSPLRTRVLVKGAKDWSPFGLAVTPDGGHIRYLGTTGRWLAIPLAGGRPLHLPGNGVWARDGRYAFTRSLAPVRAGGQDRVEVEIGDQLGRRARPAGLFAFDDHGASQLTWSADGSVLLYESSARSARDLWMVDANGSNLHRLTPGGPDASAPAWSAAGQRLAYSAAPFSGGLCGFCGGSIVLARPDGRVRSTIAGSDQDGSPSWAPSGNQLVVSVCCSGELDVINLDGSVVTQLAPGPAGDSASGAAWSPDGTTIAYLAADGIDLIAPDGSAKRLLQATPGNQAASALAWSHDGTLLAYSSANGIHILTVDGTARPRLLVAARSPGRLSFSPDDAQLVYAAQPPTPAARHQNDLYIISLHGGTPHALAPSPYDDTDPAWRPPPPS